MALAKRQRTEKHTKIEQRKVQGLEGEPLVKQTAFLASPVYKGQAQRRGDFLLLFLYICLLSSEPALCKLG